MVLSRFLLFRVFYRYNYYVNAVQGHDCRLARFLYSYVSYRVRPFRDNFSYLPYSSVA